MHDWLIIGGGIHGCTIAAFLIKHKKVQNDKLCIIDPHDEPMARWKRNTERIDMPYLRSPSVHHIDTHPLSLQYYSNEYGDERPFYGLYKRPSLLLFNDHSDKVIMETNLKECWHKGLVKQVKKKRAHWEITTETGNSIHSKNVVVAISVNQQLLIPKWANDLVNATPKQVHHIFEEDLPELTTLKGPFAIIGGGITAAHLAIKLAGEHPGEVTLIKRHPFRVHDFDSDPGWLGSKLQRPYDKVKDYAVRRELIKTARLKGSVPKDVLLKLKRLVSEQKLQIVDGEVQSYALNGVDLSLKVEDQTINVRHVLLATGFLPTRPGEWLEELIIEEQLQCATCGYPVINKDLQWCPHLYVMGPLAELEVGPIARNISGARQAAERIVASL